MTADAQRRIVFGADRYPLRILEIRYRNLAGAHCNGALPQLVDERQHDLRVMVVGGDVVNPRADEHASADCQHPEGACNNNANFHYALHRNYSTTTVPTMRG